MEQGKSIIKEIKQQYNTIAKEWDLSRFAPSGIKIKQIKKLKSGDKLLDLGCGNGLIVLDVLKRKARYVGVDISLALIKITKRKYPKVMFVVGDATKKLKFKNSSFDKVFSFAVMHHIPTEKLRLKFLQEIQRVLKSGGEATIINWNLLNEKLAEKYNIFEQLKLNQTNDVRVPWKATKGKDVQRYLHIFTKKEMLALAKQAGFKFAQAGFYQSTGKREENGEEMVVIMKK